MLFPLGYFAIKPKCLFHKMFHYIGFTEKNMSTLIRVQKFPQSSYVYLSPFFSCWLPRSKTTRSHRSCSRPLSMFFFFSSVFFSSRAKEAEKQK